MKNHREPERRALVAKLEKRLKVLQKISPLSRHARTLIRSIQERLELLNR